MTASGAKIAMKANVHTSDSQTESPAGAPSQRWRMASTMTVLGYDPEKGRFVGTWLGTMMSKLWVYEGFLDETKRVLTLESEGPSMTKEGETGKYRDIFTIIDEDYHTMTGNFLGDDGVWHEMMTMHFRRKK